MITISYRTYAGADHLGIENLAQRLEQAGNRGMVLQADDIRSLDRGTRILESYAGSRTLGILLYRIGTPDAPWEWDAFMREQLIEPARIVDAESEPVHAIDHSQIPGLRTDPSPIARVDFIESFLYGMGIGASLIMHLQREPDIGSIVLEASFGSVELYEASQFRMTGLFIEKLTMPIMVWTRSGQY